MIQEILSNETYMVIISIIFSFIPFIIWILLFKKMKHEQWGLIIKTSIGGVLCAVPILILQYFMTTKGVFDIIGIIKGEINVYNVIDGIKTGFSNIYVQTLLTFIFVGILEEYAKHIVVVKIDSKQDQFKSLIDSVQFSIIAALGFTLIENSIYFYNIMKIEGIEGFFVPFLFRSVLSVFAHIFFSAVYGYYYGMAIFAKEEVIEEIGHGRHFYVLHWISKIFKIDLITLFRGKELTLGLFLAMTLHAIYNTLLALNLLYVAIPFIGIGYLYVMYEFDKKSNYINYKKIEDEIKTNIMLKKLKDEKAYVSK